MTMLEPIQGSPTQLTVQWRPPEEPNGELLAYSVYCRKSTRQPLCNCDSTISVNSTSCPCGDLEQDTSYHRQAVLPVDVPHVKVIGGFSPYTNYTCFMTANTSAGESSPGIPHSSTTDESSESFFNVIRRGYIVCCILTHMVINCIYLIAAPSAAPLAVQAFPSSSYNITILWSPPPEIDRNGVIIYYEIQLTETETGTEFQWTSPELTTTRGSLHPHFHYEFRVAARTSIGTGPSSAVETVQTLPAGTSLLFLFHCLWPLCIVPLQLLQRHLHN